MAGENGAVVLDANLPLDGGGKQVAQNAQHRGDGAHADHHQIVAHRHFHCERGIAAGQHAINHRGDHADQHTATDAANGSLHRFVGADDGRQLMFAEGPPRKVGEGIAAPRKAENEQDKIDGVILEGVKGQHPL